MLRNPESYVRWAALLAGPLFLLATGTWTASAQESGTADLPIRKVILYKHGIGYFERSGAVSGDATANLRFSSGQMNDVLKSLTALDLSGGHVTTIGYDSQAPASRLLGEFGFELPANGALIAMIRMFRGAQVEVDVNGRKMTGSILGVETRQVAAGDKVAEVPRVSLLVDNNDVRSFDAVGIQALRFLDDDLRHDVRRYLEILNDSYRAERKSMQLRLEGKGEREIFVSYTVEVPVWKATYRLVLGDKDLLQGWAIVDNTSEEDWNEVDLSLVAGLPVSFVQDLYTPRYTRRPVVEVSEELAVAPQTHEGGWEKKDKLADAKANDSTRRAAGKNGPATGGPGTPTMSAERTGIGSLASKSRSEAFEEALDDSQTWTRELGNLFEYKVERPVSVARNRSALIPIVGASVEAEEVSLYNAQARAGNALSAVRFKNTTGLTLEGGPVMVLSGDAYAGEALIETLEPGEKRYLSYAVDLALKIDTKQESGVERVERVRCLNGLLWVEGKIITTTGYMIRNGDEKPRALVLEHPRRPGFTLVATAKPIEETAAHFRFEAKVGGAQTVLFEVKEESATSSQYSIGSLSPDDVELFVRRKLLTPEMEKALRSLLEAKAELAELQRRSGQFDKEIDQIGRDQDRLRKNLQALGTTNAEQQLRGRYVDQLGKGEDRLSELTKKKQDLDDEIARKQAELDQRIRDLALDGSF